MSKALLHSLGQSISFGRLPLLGKVLWPMLLAASDDQGRGIAEADVVKWHICPNVTELTNDNILDILGAMVTQGMILLYKDAQGQWLYQVTHWWEYQMRYGVVGPSQYEAPPGWVGQESVIRRPYQPTRQKKRRLIFSRDGETCQYCGKPAEHLDHVFPRSRGGPDTEDNLVAACAWCNLSKGARTPKEAGMVLRSQPNVITTLV